MTPTSTTRPFVVGLTGGIGSGKSAVADLFAARGVEVIDTDVISREVVTPASEALARIVDHFGEGVLLPDGSLDRARLRQAVFADETARTWLEALLHPAIRERVRQRVESSNASWLMVVVPLLLETGAYDFVDRILVVHAPAGLRRQRVLARDGGSETTIDAIMARQLSDEDRLARADDVIDNSGTLSVLPSQVEILADRYEELAHDRHQAG